MRSSHMVGVKGIALPVILQTCVQRGNAQSLSPVFPSPMTNGSIIIVFSSCVGSTQTVPTDTAGQTYVLDKAAAGATFNVYSTLNSSTSSAFHVTGHAAAIAQNVLYALEVANVRASSPLDATGTAAATSTSASVTSSATTFANEFAIAAVFDPAFGAGNTWTGLGIGWTDKTALAGGSNVPITVSYKVLSTTGAQTESWSSGLSEAYIALIATYKGN